MEIGISTFAELTPDPATGKTVSPFERLSNLMEEIELSDQLGLDVYAVGEHHRPDFAVSSPSIILAAAAVKTKNIRLSSAVSVLSSDDPIRVYQQFAEVDLLSRGRAEIMAGRGSFTESFPLFGYDLKDYDELFTEKLRLLMEVNSNEKISWKGKFTPSIINRGVYPRPYQEKLPIWIAVGGTPESVLRAGTLGLPLAIAIIGGSPAHFVSLSDLYKETYIGNGHDVAKMQIAVHSHGFIAETSKHAADIFYGPYAQVMTQLGRERGWDAMTRDYYEMLRAPKGSLLVGDPQEVIDKILYEQELFGLTRFLLHISVGTMPHKDVLKCIELLGNVVAPAVRKASAK